MVLPLLLSAVLPSLPGWVWPLAWAAPPPAASDGATDAAPLPAVMANADPLDDAIVAPPEPVPGCEAALTAAGVVFSTAKIPVHRNRSGDFLCGAEQVVRYTRGPGKIRWRGSPKVSCGMALALAGFEGAIQQEAEAQFGARVAKVVHMGTYNCREMAAYPGWVSEHSYANALDIKTFVLTNGREVDVRRGWSDAASEPAPGSRAAQDAAFLRAVARRAFDDDHFSVVLTPAFDAAHRGHFHLDLARYRVDGTAGDGT